MICLAIGLLIGMLIMLVIGNLVLDRVTKDMAAITDKITRQLEEVTRK